MKNTDRQIEKLIAELHELENTGKPRTEENRKAIERAERKLAKLFQDEEISEIRSCASFKN